MQVHIPLLQLAFDPHGDGLHGSIDVGSVKDKYMEIDNEYEQKDCLKVNVMN